MNIINNWESGDVIANGLRIHYYRSGGTGRTLVLAHGITDSGECWPRVAAALAPAYDLVTYDARGHGRSETPRAPYRGTDQAADLAGLVGALGLEKPVAIGHSMGASSVSLAAYLYPDLFATVVLEDPPWREVAPGAPTSGVSRYSQRLIEYHSMGAQGLIAFGRQYRVGWAEDELEPWALAKQMCRAEALERMAPGGPAWQDVARGITCPALLLTADPEVQAAAGLGAIVTAEIAAEAEALLRQGRVVHIPGAGHNIRRENFEGYISAVSTFLRAL
ncbi:MAG: alpha/beta fold hydrolase [Anaerolineae bacterium]